MNIYESKNIRNIALVGHSGSGKTSVVESLMLRTGVIRKKGTIEEGNTLSDCHELEIEKKHSCFTYLLSTEHQKVKINILDTPGYEDYIGRVASSIKAADTVVSVINATKGFEVGAEIHWELAENENKPSAILVNKLDNEGIEFEEIVKDLVDHWGKNVTIVQYPINSGNGFDSVVNLITKKMYVYKDGELHKEEIPESEKERYDRLHGELVESIAEIDEELMEHYFESGDLVKEELWDGLRKAMIDRQIFPVMAVSAATDTGDGAFLDAIMNYFPSPSDLPAVIAQNGRKVMYDSKAPTSAMIFKMYADPRQGDINYFKVYSGTLRHSDDLLNTSNNHEERIGHIYIYHGGQREEVQELRAGDLGATVKLKHSHINHTLVKKGFELKLPTIKYPKPKVRRAIEPVHMGQDEKLGTSLNHLHWEDPSFVVEHSTELKQIILHGQGEQHLEEAKWRLEHRYNVDVKYVDAKVPYRETIQKSAKGDYRHKKQSGGAGQFAEVHIQIEPWYEGIPDPEKYPVRGREIEELPWGGKLEFINSIVGGVIDQRFLPAIKKGVLEKMENGPISGSYVRDVRVIIFDGKMHSVDSNEAAFKTAGMMAFKDTFLRASPKLLEPIYNVKVISPESHIGDIMSDLPHRRGVIMGIETERRNQVVNAKMPLAELDRYASALRSITKGESTFSFDFDGYEPVPANVQIEIEKKNKEQND
jgi:elongation factor G